jgi:hypothetical protein
MKTLTRQVLTCVLIILSSLAFIIGCQKTGNESKNKESSRTSVPLPPPEMEGDVLTYTDPETGITLTYTYSYSNTETDSTLTTSLVATNSESDPIIDYGTFVLNGGNVKEKDALTAMITSAYGSLFTTYGYSTLQSYAGLVEKMLESISEEAEESDMKNYVFQSLCMFNTLAKAVNRDNARTGSVPFTVGEGYLRDLSSFAVEEDVLIDVDDFKAWLETQREVQPGNEGIDYFTNGLATVTGTQTLKFVNLAMEDFFEPGGFPQGTECGCCGNYVGPCAYWSTLCLVHDYTCQNCRPWWYCFRGCKPTSCSGNTISTYWFIYRPS